MPRVRIEWGTHGCAHRRPAVPGAEAPENGGGDTGKLRVGVVFGGRSGEHEVSLMSARSVLAALDPERFEAVPVGITREGRWLPPGPAAALLRDGAAAAEGAGSVVAAVAPGQVLTGASGARPPLDVVFPLVHGPSGEDGTLQGLLELSGLPYVGAGVLGSALGMDKIVQKEVLAHHGLPVVAYRTVSRRQWREDPQGVVDALAGELGLPCFVKPANLGSSVGITKAHTCEELRAGLRAATRLDRRVIAERAVPECREIECGVLGNEHPGASVPGEVIPRREFYDYEAKYSEAGADLVVPAPLPAAVATEVAALAVRAFVALDCAGMARVDFFLDRRTLRPTVNEVNTIPGFTATSMFPRLWEASGLPYRALVTRLIELALERHTEGRGVPGEP